MSQNESFVDDMQKKYSAFTKEVLNLQKDTQIQNNENFSQMQVIREEIKRERNILEDKTKAISLYFSEREVIDSKIEDIYCKILRFVTKDDFEGYRKSQTKMFQEKFHNIEEEINKILPEDLKRLLPSMAVRLQAVEELPEIKREIAVLQEEKASLEQRVIKNHSDICNHTANLEAELSLSIERVKADFNQKLEQVNIQQ